MMEISDFLFVDLEEGEPPAEGTGRAVEVLRVGEFVDRNGKDVVITGEDLDAFVANFEAGAAGQEVPVDVVHERREAAGWIRRVWREGEKLLATVDWNALGRELVEGKIYRYLSATIDTARKVIKGVSLVNFPAVKGLRPVELGEGAVGLRRAGLLERVLAELGRKGPPSIPPGGGEEVVELMIRKEGEEVVLYSKDGSKVLGRFPFGADEEYEDEDAARAAAEEREKEIERISRAKERETSEEDKSMDPKEQELREQIREEVEAELREQVRTQTEMEERIRAEVTAELREEISAEIAEAAERHQGFVEFAEGVCAKDGGTGLAASVEEVVEFLEGLPDEAVEGAKKMLSQKVVDLGEVGSQREGKGEKKPLPKEIRADLEAWIAAEQPVAEFFQVNAEELGEMGEWDLSEYEAKDK